MSELTNALKRISSWMEAQHPFPVKDGQTITPYRPGLSDTDIINLTDNLPFKLPEEVKEFYKWHNGDWSTRDNRFSGIQDNEITDLLYVNPGIMHKELRPFINEEIIFLSLDEAVSCFGYASKFDEKPYLPIFSEENGYYSLLITEGNSAPVLIDDYEIIFPSLTVLMQSIAEVLEKFDSFKSANKSSLTIEREFEFRDKLTNEVVHKYVGKLKFRSALFALSQIIS